MSESERAKRFAELDPEGFVRLDGVDDAPSDWHINDKFILSSGDDALEALLAQFTGNAAFDPPDADTTYSMVFQRADASEEWLIVIVNQTDDGDFEFADSKLSGGQPGSYTDIEDDIDVLEYSETKANLGDSNE